MQRKIRFLLGDTFLRIIRWNSCQKVELFKTIAVSKLKTLSLIFTYFIYYVCSQTSYSETNNNIDKYNLIISTITITILDIIHRPVFNLKLN
jgi:hypothetical protein